MRRVVVVGGGITGLAAAHRLTERDPSAEVHVLEASERAGGMLRSERTDGYVIERGPDSILTSKPAALHLAQQLGLDGELVSTRTEYRGAYVVAHGRLRRLPEGFELLAPTRPGPFVRSPIVSWAGKLRAGADLVRPRGDPEVDESLASFVSRRFGQEVLERLAQPLVGGIYGADARRLSLGATMPRFVQTEQTDRSLVLGLRKRRKAAGPQSTGSGARYGLFVSFRRGVQTLPDALVRTLGDRVHTKCPVRQVEPSGTGWRVVRDGDSSMHADAVILAVHAWPAARMVADTDPELERMLGALRYGSAATVTFAWRREEIPHPLDAFGFVVPKVERRALLACTWASVKWPGRAPEGMVVLRAFVGGADWPESIDWDDDELQLVARRELRQLMGITAPPTRVWIDRYRDAMPRYELGHMRRVDAIEAQVAPHRGLELAGNAYRGVGIPDAIASGQRAADAVCGAGG
jgi:oxygen-dependent protoporphyrinogen oxidase